MKSCGFVPASRVRQDPAQKSLAEFCNLGQVLIWVVQGAILKTNGRNEFLVPCRQVTQTQPNPWWCNCGRRHSASQRPTVQDELEIASILDHTRSTRTRRGGSCLRALGIYIRPFSSIELACAVRQPSPCVHAFFESGVLFHMSHLKLHFALHASHSTLQTPHSTLHTSHCTLPTAHSILRTSQYTLHTSHFTVHTSHFTLHTSHFPLHTSHFTVHTSHFTLHTSHFTLHTSHCTLHAPHFTLHPSHSTLHLI